MNQHDLALELLQLASDDLAAARVLARSDEIRDAIVCFHCQQTVEKSLKAVLAERSVDFPKTHNLIVLRELLPSADRAVLTVASDLSILNPYAVGFRYQVVISSGLDRMVGLDLAQQVHDWATGLLQKHP